MHLSSLLVFAGVAVAANNALIGAHTPEEILAKLQNRQIEYCKEIKPPYTCARSCGTGYAECGAFPHCYNPTRGETCCRNGKYCPAKYYCTDAGCCPEDMTLQECGATQIMTGAPPSSTQPPISPPGGGDEGDEGDEDEISSSSEFSLALPTPTRTALVPTESDEEDSFPSPTRPVTDPFGEPAETTAAQGAPNAASRLEGGLLTGLLGMLAMLI